MKVSRRTFLASAGGALAASALSTGSCAQREGISSRPPNIVFVYTDDQGQWAVGAYGNRDVFTPNMDRLAREGALFTRAFVSTPVCSPARASVMTSLYSHQTGIHDYIARSETDLGLALRFTVLPQLLKHAGYTNALFGKWHLGVQKRYWPTNRGFDHFFGFLGGGNKPKDPVLWVEGKEQKFSGFLTDILTDHAIEWLRRNYRRPFTLWLHTRAPHKSYLPVPEEDMAPYREKDVQAPKVEGVPLEKVKQERRNYYASITGVDRNLGKILKELDRLGISGRTVVVFTSDNGYMIGQHGLETKGNGWTLATPRKRRPNMFDNSILVPLIIRWPGMIKPGTVINEMVAEIDFLPTFLDIVGASVPDYMKPEGRSFLPLLRGEKPTWRDTIYGSYDMHHGAVANMRMIRTEEWKLVRHFEPGVADELYNLKDDPGELRNLHGKPETRAIEQELVAKLAAWQRATNDPLAPET